MKEVEDFFDYYNVIEEKKRKLVEKCLQASVADWWQQLKFVRQRMGMTKIKKWNKMKEMGRKLLPKNHLPIKSVDLKHNFYKLNFDDKSKLE